MKWKARWYFGVSSPAPVFAGYKSNYDPAFSHDFNLSSDWDQEGGQPSDLTVPQEPPSIPERPPFLCGWLEQVQQDLMAFSKLGDDWDGYGAAGTNPEAILAASVYLRRLAESCDVARPVVTPTRLGGVLVAWRNGAHRLEITFAPAAGASFVYLDLSDKTKDRGEIAVLADEKRLFRLLARHFGP